MGSLLHHFSLFRNPNLQTNDLLQQSENTRNQTRFILNNAVRVILFIEGIPETSYKGKRKCRYKQVRVTTIQTKPPKLYNKSAAPSQFKANLLYIDVFHSPTTVYPKLFLPKVADD